LISFISFTNIQKKKWFVFLFVLFLLLVSDMLEDDAHAVSTTFVANDDDNNDIDNDNIDENVVIDAADLDANDVAAMVAANEERNNS
jgi:hypothetical protein